MLQRFRTVFLLALLAAPSQRIRAGSPDALVFLVPARASTRELSSTDVRRIYLGDLTRWPNHRRVVLGVGPSSTPAAGVFYDRVLRMSEIDFSQRWLGIVFRGEAPTSPRVLASREAVSRFLSQNPDGLVFLLLSEIDSLDGAVRPLAVDGTRPMDPAYPFRLR
jgi:hypothetical protein